MAVNAHRSFNGSQDDTYLRQLRVPDETAGEMRGARDEVRETLRTGFQDWKRNLNEGTAQGDLVVALDEGQSAPIGTPKFRMQGSMSYHTANDPAHKPPQQIDLDDGMFLPVSFLDQDSGIRPALVSAAYFRVVEEALGPLCDEKGWTLVTDKASCVRIELNEECHLDVALYAVPDDEFETLIETAANSRNDITVDGAFAQLEILDEAYASLDSDQMVLAHRKKGWMPSDPRELEDWFKEAVSDYGPQVRTVSRYLKGWRDQEWEDCRLSSIALMSATVTVFEENGAKAFEGRDDLALLAVAKRLPTILEGRIANPRVEGVFLDDGWSPNERKGFVSGAHTLANVLTDAIEHSTSASFTVDRLQSVLGHRVPDDETLVTVEADGASESLTAPAVAKLFKDDDADARKAVEMDGDERYG